MQISRLKNHFLYWIDRFDHILGEEEFQDIALYSFVNVNDVENKTLINAYLLEEQKLVNFVFSVINRHDCNLAQSRLRYSRQSTCSNSVKHLFNQEQIEILENTADREYEQEIILDSEQQLRNFLQLGIRELLKIKVKIAEAYVEIGFDMSLTVQNILEAELVELVQDAGLYILRKWEQPMWDY